MLTAAAARPPWERRAKETNPAFEAFATYRDMSENDRSVREVARRLHKSVTLIGRWSSTHEWVARVRAWEDEQDRIWRESINHERRKAAERQIRTAQLAQSKAAQALIQLDPERMSVAELTRMLEISVKIERDAMGEANRVDVTTAGQPVTDPLASLTPEERIARLRELRAQIDNALIRTQPE
jgi:hypothetical protein